MSTWQDILNQVSAMRRESSKLGVTLWYRGQRETNWPIRSTLHRRIIEYFQRTGVHFGESEDRAFLHDEYKSVYRKFKAQAWHLIDPMERTDWGIVFRMQHHGFPTRLLDWTRSFACAVYFAQFERDPTKDAVVHVLNPEGLNLLGAGREGLVALDDSTTGGNIDTRPYHPRWVSSEEELPTIAVVPYLTNKRMVAQSSAFTLNGDSFLPLEDQFGGQLVGKHFLTRIILPAELYRDTEDFLATVGLGHFEYFPDLEGLRASYHAEMERTILHAKEMLDDMKGASKPTA